MLCCQLLPLDFTPNNSQGAVGRYAVELPEEAIQAGPRTGARLYTACLQQDVGDAEVPAEHLEDAKRQSEETWFMFPDVSRNQMKSGQANMTLFMAFSLQHFEELLHLKLKPWQVAVSPGTCLQATSLGQSHRGTAGVESQASRRGPAGATHEGPGDKNQRGTAKPQSTRRTSGYIS